MGGPDLQSFCREHPSARSQTTCSRCDHGYCSKCVVYPRGPKRPAMCVQCALAAAGVRSSSGPTKLDKPRSAWRPWKRRSRPEPTEPTEPTPVEPAVALAAIEMPGDAHSENGSATLGEDKSWADLGEDWAAPEHAERAAG